MRHSALLLFVFFVFNIHQLRAQNPVQLPKVTGKLTLDGRVNEQAWERIEPLPLQMLFPQYGGTLTERTEIRVAYNDGYVWASIRAFDSESDKIRINSLYRDRDSGDDTFILILDTFNSDETAMQFKVTPAGTRIDRLILNDAEPGRGPTTNDDWNTFWDAEATVTDEGWFAEMRIPFSSLRFKANDEDKVVMGLRTFRWIPRKGENQIYPLTSPNEASTPWLNLSMAEDVSLQNVSSSNPIYITPYILGGANLANQFSAPDNLFKRIVDERFEVGGDLKYSVSSNLTLDLTVNTDFAQVEADDEQLNLGRFSLFFPEKRPFFQERSDIFSFSMGGSTRLFYSRRIGLSSGGEPIGIYGGARFAGSASGIDIGVLNMQTEVFGDFASENFGVVRLRKPIFNSGSNAGIIYTHRVGTDGTYNYAYGFDTNIQLTDRHLFAVRWAQTFDEALPQTIDASRFLARLEKIGREGISYVTEFVWSGRYYQPDVGFVSARDFKGGIANLRYGWVPNNKNIREASVETGIFTRVRNRENVVEYLNTHIAGAFNTSTNARASLRLNYFYDNLPVPINITPAVFVPIDTYEFINVSAAYRSPSGRLLRVASSVTAGSFYDGNRLTFELSPTWNISSHLEVGVDYNLNRIRFGGRNQELNAHIIRTRFNYAFNRHFSIGNFIQFNSTQARAILNSRLRYNFSEGHDLYIVLNGDYNTDRYQAVGQPILPRTNQGLFLLKYSRTIFG